MFKRLRVFEGLLLLLCLCVQGPVCAQETVLAADINETVVRIPVIVNGKADGSLPAFGKDGHQLFVRGASIWQPLVAAFFKSVGF